MTVRDLTRCEQVIGLLNQFGHGYSSSKIIECETALTEDLMGEQPDECHIPAHIDHASTVIFCWDNNGLAEETLSGRGTTHCTNGVVIQRATHAGHKATTQPPRELQKRLSKRRSLKAMPVPLVEYDTSTHWGPHPAAVPEDTNNNPSSNEPQSQGLNSKELEAAINLICCLVILNQTSSLFQHGRCSTPSLQEWIAPLVQR